MTDSAFTIAIDTREQLPYEFDQFGVESVVRTLATGDYAPDGFAEHCAIERKSPGDFQGCMTRDRARFERELARLDALEYAAVVVECELLDFCRMHCGRMSPKSFVGTIIAWRQRYQVDFWFCPGRAFAEKLTFKLCERFVRDIADGKRPNPVREVATV